MAMKDKNKLLRKRMRRLLRKYGPLDTLTLFDLLKSQHTLDGRLYQKQPTMSSMCNILSRHSDFVRTGDMVPTKNAKGDNYSVLVWTLREGL